MITCRYAFPHKSSPSCHHLAVKSPPLILLCLFYCSFLLFPLCTLCVLLANPSLPAFRTLQSINLIESNDHFVQAGMEPWDVTMSDLLNGRASLDSFRGIIFVGGFSYADTLDSAKGWGGETDESFFFLHNS